MTTKKTESRTDALSKLTADAMFASEPWIGFSEQLRKAMSEYREKNQISVSAHADKVKVPSHVILAIEKGIVKLEDIPFMQLVSLYQAHKQDMGKYVLDVTIQFMPR